MNVIPLPNKYKINSGYFIIDSNSKINYSHELESSALYFSNFISKLGNVVIEKTKYASINFVLDFELAEEQFVLKITEELFTLSARTNKGAFYGVQTLIQIFHYQDGILKLPCLEIDDIPAFSYRGFMLDVARHFFDKNEVFRLIDLISFHKFNFLHLHLTDDQGWRIEIEKYPLLTEIGSKRKSTTLKSKKLDDKIHQGYYSKDDLKAIVTYAKNKNVEVIPEIDMPGHMNALIASYPYTSCTNEEIEVRSRWGISKHILCAGNEQVYTMLEDILLELFEIFDSKYIHIGGDEVPKDSWKKCRKCQQVIKENNLKNEHGLQTYFFNHFSNFLREHNKKAIGWNDCISKNLNKSAVLQHWKPFSNKKTVNEINNGRQVIISNFFSLYLDYPYSLTPLKKTYNFNPILKKVKNPENIIGIEAPLWTEWVNDSSKLDFQIFPRLAAVAEVSWTNKENKDYYFFLSRLKHLYKLYDKLGINYAKSKEKSSNIIKRFFNTIKWIKNEDTEFLNNSQIKKHN